jgi:DNA-directed RNA polymerase subunit K/omega
MRPNTDYIRHAAKLARQAQMQAAMGETPTLDADFFKTLAKALDEMAAGLEQVSARE